MYDKFPFQKGLFFSTNRNSFLFFLESLTDMGFLLSAGATLCFSRRRVAGPCTAALRTALTYYLTVLVFVLSFISLTIFACLFISCQCLSAHLVWENIIFPSLILKINLFILLSMPLLAFEQLFETEGERQLYISSNRNLTCYLSTNFQIFKDKVHNTTRLTLGSISLNPQIVL